MDLEELAMLLDTMETGDVSQEEFENACEASKGIPKLDDEQRLQLYGIKTSANFRFTRAANTPNRFIQTKYSG